MKKIITKVVCLLCAGALVLGAAGCSKSADSSSAASSTAAAVYGSAEDYDYENFSYSSGLDENGYWEGVKALDYVTLPENFASLTFKRSEIEPTEEEIQSEIDSLLSDHATEKQVTDRAAADGDTVNIDYAGSVDGVAFSGGTYSGYSLTLGSGTFVDGFEDQIVGHTPGGGIQRFYRFRGQHRCPERQKGCVLRYPELHQREGPARADRCVGGRELRRER